jgi:hypothetical protein
MTLPAEKDWANAGFPVGNHTLSHLELSMVNARTYIANTERMDQRLTALNQAGDSLGFRHIFRYPYIAEGSTRSKSGTRVRYYLLAKPAGSSERSEPQIRRRGMARGGRGSALALLALKTPWTATTISIAFA